MNHFFFKLVLIYSNWSLFTINLLLYVAQEYPWDSPGLHHLLPPSGNGDHAGSGEENNGKIEVTFNFSALAGKDISSQSMKLINVPGFVAEGNVVVFGFNKSYLMKISYNFVVLF